MTTQDRETKVVYSYSSGGAGWFIHQQSEQPAAEQQARAAELRAERAERLPEGPQRG